MKKSSARIAVLLLLAMSILAACGGAKSTSPTAPAAGDGSLDRVKKAGKLVICVDDAYAPMEFRDEKGALIGFDVDLMAAVATKIGVTTDWKATAWDGIIPSLKSKQCDMIVSSMNITDERKQEVNFTDAYLQMGQILMVAKGNSKGIKTLNDLQGKTIAVQIGTTNAEAAKAVKGATVKEFDTFPLAMQEVAAGRADATIADTPIGKFYLVQNPGKGEVVGAEIDPLPVGGAIRKEDNQLREAVNKAVTEMNKDGSMQKLKDKWFGK